MAERQGEVTRDKRQVEGEGACRKETSEAVLPAFWIAGTVKDGDNGNDIRLHEEEHLVWESSRQNPADTPINDRMLKRVAQDGVHSRIDGYKEIRTESGDPAFVPVEGLRKFRLRFGPDDQPIGHLRLPILSRTTDQGAPAVGSL